MSRKERSIIFSAELETPYNQRSQGIRLHPGTDSLDIPLDQLEMDAISIINNKLPNDLNSIFKLDVKINVISTRYGSIVIFFDVLLTAFQIISRYKSFIDSVNLIKDHCELLLRSMVLENYGLDINVNVEAKYPSVPNHAEIAGERLLNRIKGRSTSNINKIIDYGFENQNRRNKRDIFFWYLLIMNIILLSSIGFLVFAAIKNTYF